MAFVYAYTLFETYLADLIRLHLSDREAGVSCGSLLAPFSKNSG
jgi:hypothetical protein